MAYERLRAARAVFFVQKRKHLYSMTFIVACSTSPSSSNLFRARLHTLIHFQSPTHVPQHLQRVPEPLLTCSETYTCFDHFRTHLRTRAHVLNFVNDLRALYYVSLTRFHLLSTAYTRSFAFSCISEYTNHWQPSTASTTTTT